MTSASYGHLILFRLRIHESNGTVFENLFCSTMRKAHSDFQKVKPQGSKGDRKNDGFRASAEIYYQVYAPENPSASDNAAKAVDKAKTDFEGLYAHWNSIHTVSHYRFVYNDKYLGVFPDVYAALTEIQSGDTVETAEVFAASDLEDVFCSLSDNDKESIVGLSPDLNSIPEMTVGPVADAVHHVMRNMALSSGANSDLIVPDFEEKIKHNEIGEYVRDLLRLGTYQSSLVDRYFEISSDFTKDQLRDCLEGVYGQAMNSTPDPDEVVKRGDLIFFKMVELICGQKGIAQQAAVILISYYFESCDVYEDPTT